MKYSAIISKIYSSFSATILLCLLALCLAPADLWAQTTVTVQGIVELEGETDYGGVEVYFDPQSPSAAGKTVTTNSDGTWTANSVNVGIYTVRFNKEGFVPARIPDVFFDQDSVLATQNMRIGGLKEIAGSVSGTMSGDTLYVVTDSIWVETGNSLEIEAGAEFQFKEGAGLGVSGSFSINGTSTDSVLFTSGSDLPEAGDWKGVHINNADQVELNHLTVVNALMPLKVENTDGVIVNNLRNTGMALNTFGIILRNSQNVSINNSILTANSRPIIVFDRAHNSTIDNTSFYLGDRVLFVHDSDNVAIRNSEFIDYKTNVVYGNIYNEGNDNIYEPISINYSYSREIIFNNNTIDTKRYNAQVINIGSIINGSFNQNEIRLHGDISQSKSRLQIFYDNNYSNDAQDEMIEFVENQITFAHSGFDTDYSTGEIFYLINDYGSDPSLIKDNTITINPSSDYYRAYRFNRIYNIRNTNLINNAVKDFTEKNYYSGPLFYINDSDSVKNNTIYIPSAYDIYASSYEANELRSIGEFSGNEIVSSERYSGSQQRWTFQNVSKAENNYFELPGNTYNSDPIFTLDQNTSFYNNTLISDNGIRITNQENKVEVTGNLFFFSRYENNPAVTFTQNSSGTFRNNTITKQNSASSAAILIEDNAAPKVLNNHFQGYANGVKMNSVPNEFSFNNFDITADILASGSSTSLPQLGTFSTVNHQGTSSDIYFNINENVSFVDTLSLETFSDSVRREKLVNGTFTSIYDDNFNYMPKAEDPIVDAGSDKYQDADGTRSDIGGISFDYGNPKNLRAAETGEASITLSFDPVLRDSVSGYRIIGGTDPADLSEMSLVTDPEANSVVLTGLTNNENYYLIAKTVFNNTESIPTDTVTAIPGTASFTVSSDSLIYVLSDTDTSKTISYQIANTGTKEFSVGGEMTSAPDFENIGYSFSENFRYSNSYYYNLPEDLSDEEVLYMQVSGEIYYNSLRWDAQNFIGTNSESSDSSFYQPELLINGQVVTALESGITDDHIYTFILSKGDFWNNGSQLQFQFNRNYDSYMNGQFNLKFAPISSSNFDETILSVNDTDTVSTTLSLGNAPKFMENSITVKRSDASDSVTTHSTYLVKESTFGLSPTYFDEVATGNDPVYLALSSVRLDDQPIQTGDEVAVYSGNDLVSSFSHNGVFPKIIKLDVSSAGSPLTFQIYDNSSGQLVSVTTGEEVVASASSLTQVDLSATLIASQNIRFYPSKFNLISLNVFPSDGSPASVFGGVSDLEIVQDDEGSVFIPSYNVNTIGQINGERGYYLFTSGEDTLDFNIDGSRKLPSETDIELSGNRFNIVPNLYSDSVSIEEAMGGLRDKVVIAQDDEGNVWMPSDDVNTIGQMVPGKGYLLYVSGNDTTYNFPDTLYTNAAKRKLRSVPTTEADFFVDVESSGLPYTILIDEVSSIDDWEQIDELALFTGPNSEQMVGSAKIESHDLPLALTAWKQNEDYELPGFKSGDQIIMKGYLADSDQVIEIDLTNQLGDSPPAYGEDIFSKVEAGLPLLTSNGMDSEKPRSFELKENYPNPFNPTTNIGYSVPKSSQVTLEVFNVLGQKVATLISERHNVGHFSVTWDASNVSSGVYLVRMTAGSYVNTNKMMLIK